MPLTLLFLHGWGFDARFWDPLADLLSDFPQLRDDAGYFGRPVTPAPDGPCVAVSHSFGTMRLLAAPPAQLRGLVAINGFDRFTDAPAFPGIARRVVDRMVSAMAQEPETVLADFRIRCGDDRDFGIPDANRLQAALVDLRDRDLRESAAAMTVPVLSLQGAEDPILGMMLRESVFAAATRVMRRTHPHGGHLLPVQDPQWCAEAIRSFARTLT